MNNESIENLSPDSRVWIYQCNRNLTDQEVSQTDVVLQRFSNQWVSHNRQLKALGKIYHNRFLVLMVDQTLSLIHI